MWTAVSVCASAHACMHDYVRICMCMCACALGSSEQYMKFFSSYHYIMVTNVMVNGEMFVLLILIIMAAITILFLSNKEVGKDADHGLLTTNEGNGGFRCVTEILMVCAEANFLG